MEMTYRICTMVLVIVIFVRAPFGYSLNWRRSFLYNSLLLVEYAFISIITYFKFYRKKRDKSFMSRSSSPLYILAGLRHNRAIIGISKFCTKARREPLFELMVVPRLGAAHDFDRGHSPVVALSATGSARLSPP